MTGPGLAWRLAAFLPVPLGALWMALGPQLPAFRGRRALLAAVTWFASRAALAGVIAAPHSTWAVLRGILGGVATFGLAGPHGVPAVAFADSLAPGAFAALVVIAADLLAWRSLAAAEGDGSEAEWNWVSSPLVLGLAVLLGTPRVALSVALAAGAYVLAKRGRSLPAGVALGSLAAWGGPPAALAALALVAGAPRARVRLAAGAAVACAAAFAWRALAPGVALAWPWATPVAPGAGPSLGQLLGGLGHAASAPWTWAPCAALLAWGGVRLVRRGADGPACAAWALGAYAALAPTFTAGAALAFAPLVAAWSGEDPDARGWWLLYGVVLPLTLYLDAGPMQGEFGWSWRILAPLGVAAAVLLALWPVRALVAASTRAGAEAARR